MHWNEFATDGSKSDLVDRRLHVEVESALTAHNLSGSLNRAESLGGHIMRLAQIATAMHLGCEIALQCDEVETTPVTGDLDGHAQPDHPCRYETQESI